MKNSLLLLLYLCVTAFSKQLIAQGPGSLDSTFNGNGVVLDKIEGFNTSIQKMLCQPDGKLIVTGYIQKDSFSATTQFIARYNEDGSPDFSFASNGYYLQEDHATIIHNAIILKDGKILTVGTGTYPNSIALTRFYPDGQLDTEFGVDGFVRYTSILFNPNTYNVYEASDGKLVVSGIHIDTDIFNWRPFSARFLPNGDIDTSYGEDGISRIYVQGDAQNIDIEGGALQPDGKLLMCGSLSSGEANTYDWMLLRLDAEGRPDSSFGVNGFVRKNLGAQYYENCLVLHLMPDGKILAAGSAQKHPGYHFTMVRFNADGTQDMTYGLSGKTQVTVGCCYSEILDIFEQPDGKIVACGFTKAGATYDELQFAVARFKANGAVDQTFGDLGRRIYIFDTSGSLRQFALSVLMQPNGKIVVAGYADEYNYSGTGIVVRLNSGLLVGTDEAGDEDYPLQLHPNPVHNSSLELLYTLHHAAPVNVELYDIAGKKVSDLLVSENRESGEQREKLQLPEYLPQGLYLIRLTSEEGQMVAKFSKQ